MAAAFGGAITGTLGEEAFNLGGNAVFGIDDDDDEVSSVGLSGQAFGVVALSLRAPEAPCLKEPRIFASLSAYLSHLQWVGAGLRRVSFACCVACWQGYFFREREREREMMKVFIKSAAEERWSFGRSCRTRKTRDEQGRRLLIRIKGL